jgi:hypothetical protein
MSSVITIFTIKAKVIAIKTQLLSNSFSKWMVFVSLPLYQIGLGESSASISINVPIVVKSIDESEKSI